MRAVRLVTMVLAAVAVSACSDDDGKALRPSGTTVTFPAESTAPTVPADVTTSTAAPGGIDPMPGGGTDTVSVVREVPVAHLVAVRADRQEGFDRVVFEFDSAAPGYTVGYVSRPVTQDGSGDEVQVDGDHVVEVRMTPASGVNLSGETVVPTYTGPTRIAPPTPVVAEVVRTGDFEAVLTWAVGLRDRVDFRVTVLRGPERIVVDFRNH